MPNKPLTSILIKPSGADCNLNCTYCFYLGKKELYTATKIHRMSDAVLEEMIRQVMTQSGENISFTWQGGEPTQIGIGFFQKAIDYQIKYGRNQRVGNGLQTNGTLLTSEWTTFLKKYSWLVGLSLDGPAHIHDHYRHDRGNHKTHSIVEANAKMLLEAGIETNAMCCITDYSAQFPEELYCYYKELGLNWMQFIPVVERDKYDSSKAASFSLTAEAYGKFLIKLFDLWIADFKDGVPATSIRHFETVFHRYVGFDAPECSMQKECGNYVVIEHNGDCYSCDFFVEPRWKLGNILQSKIIYMLNSKRQKVFGAEKTNLSRDCRLCSWYKYCFGGCVKDRIKDPADRMKPRFCESYKMFFAHSDETMRKLAADWQQNQKKMQNSFKDGDCYDTTMDFLKR